MISAEVPTYSSAERERRWNLARTFMEAQGLDALIVYGEHEDGGPAPFYFDTWFTNDRPGTTVIVPRTGEPISLVPMPTFVSDHLEAGRRGDGIWISPENMRVGRTAAGIIQALNDCGLAKATIGVVGLDPYPPFQPEGIIPYRLWTAVLEEFADATFKGVGVAFAALVSALSEEEIAVVRHSASIGDAMARAMVEASRPGVPESDVYAAGMAAAHSNGTVVAGLHIFSGPDPTGFGPPPWAYRPQTPRILQDGDMLNTEVFCNFGMRGTQHQVTIAIGDIHEQFERAEAVARASYDAGLEALRAGRQFGDVVDEMRKPVQEAGGLMPHPLVHTLNPFRAVGGGSATIGADMVIEPGMTFAFEPRCGFGRHVVTVGGTVLAGADGAIELNPYTAQILRAAA